MAEETGVSPAVGAAESSSPAATPGTSEQTASAVPGNAPGAGGDAGTAVDAAGTTPAVTPSEYQILNRKFRDQKHAEEVLGGELGRTRTLQREHASMQQTVAKLEAELGALRGLVAQPRGNGSGQGGTQGQQTPGGPQSFAKELADSGELAIIAKIAADPEMGIGHAMYRMAELLDKRNSEQLASFREGVQTEFAQRETRSQQERAVAKAFGAVSTLKADYPELDENNQSDEAIEAQQAVLRILNALPQGAEWLASEPQEALRYAVERYRRQNGTPMFAQPPGSSGTPAFRAAQAAEAQANAAGAVTLDGSGVPRQRSATGPETLADKIRRENRDTSPALKTPGGRPLWSPA